MGVMTAPQDPLTFTAVDTIEFSVASQWGNYVIPMRNYFGNGSFIAFKWQSSGNNALFMDDLLIDFNPNADSCAIPRNLSVSEISPRSAKITWMPGSQEQEWELSYKTMAEDEFTIVACTSPSYTLVATDSTEYEVCVRAMCNERDQSAMTCITFRTLGFSETSYTIYASAGEHGAITPNGEVTVRYDEDQRFTFAPESKYEVDSVIVNGNHLGSLAEYTFKNVRGDSTIRVTFKLTDGVRHIDLERSVLIYPNPAKEMFTVKTEATFQLCEITNMLGQLLYSVSIPETEFQVDVSSFNAGIYLIRLSGSNGVVTKKIVIE